MSKRSHPYSAVFKTLLIGDSGVGKTSLMFRFAEDTFSESFVATIGIDFKMKTIKTRDNEIVKLQLWDTAGQEKFFSITLPYYRNANCVLLVYDVTKASSFENVKRWMSHIDQHAPEHVLRVLVANKSDLTNVRVVSRTNGERLAANYAVRYYETSAKTSENVQCMFADITEAMLDMRRILSSSGRNDSVKLNDGEDFGLSNPSNRNRQTGLVATRINRANVHGNVASTNTSLNLSKARESFDNCCSM